MDIKGISFIIALAECEWRTCSTLYQEQSTITRLHHCTRSTLQVIALLTIYYRTCSHETQSLSCICTTNGQRLASGSTDCYLIIANDDGTLTSGTLDIIINQVAWQVNLLVESNTCLLQVAVGISIVCIRCTCRVIYLIGSLVSSLVCLISRIIIGIWLTI